MLYFKVLVVRKYLFFEPFFNHHFPLFCSYYNKD